MPRDPARVWVVDDDRAVRFVLATALREAGYAVDGFENARDALAALRDRGPPALLFTDVRMPGEDGLALRIEIVDDGRGVPEELAERIFLPLVSGHAAGSGLGLALAQQVAREHRGSLAYRSRPGHTVFTLLLPLWKDEAEEGTDAA